MTSAIQDLLKLVDTKSLTALDLVANDLDLVEEKQRLAYLADSLPKYMCIKQHDFTDQVCLTIMTTYLAKHTSTVVKCGLYLNFLNKFHTDRNSTIRYKSLL